MTHYKNSLGGKILLYVFLSIPQTPKGEITLSFRHFPEGTRQINILSWFNYHFPTLDISETMVERLQLMEEI